MINELVAQIEKKDAPIVVGLDPMLSYVPEYIQKKAFSEYGETLKGAAEAIWEYNKGIIDATYDLIPAVKPQIAMYEQFGIEGLIAFHKTCAYAKEKGLVIIGDIKRGDIGSTSTAYAVGHLGKVQVGSKEYAGFDEDFVTVNPYLGTDGVKPFVDVCKQYNKGIFVLVKTSNPSSGEFQDQLINGRPLYELVAEKVVEWGEACMGDTYSNVGCVVGATYPEMGKILRKLMPKTYILVPGYGAQGGKAIADILFGKCSPSGKLPITFYNSTDDLPDFCDYSMQNRTYRYFKGNVQYPFGYGRTYTKFSLEDITLIGEEIKATICNIGNEKSDTVLQLYVSYPPTEYPNPQKSLVSFKRIGLKPGERETITFKITSEYLTSANNDGKKIILDGCYKFSLTDGCDFTSKPILYQK